MNEKERVVRYHLSLLAERATSPEDLVVLMGRSFTLIGTLVAMALDQGDERADSLGWRMACFCVHPEANGVIKHWKPEQVSEFYTDLLHQELYSLLLRYAQEAIGDWLCEAEYPTPEAEIEAVAAQEVADA